MSLGPRLTGDAAITTAINTLILDMNFDDDPMILCHSGILMMWADKKLISVRGERVRITEISKEQHQIIESVTTRNILNGRVACAIKHSGGTLHLTWKKGPIHFLWTPLSYDNFSDCIAMAALITK